MYPLMDDMCPENIPDRIGYITGLTAKTYFIPL